MIDAPAGSQRSYSFRLSPAQRKALKDAAFPTASVPPVVYYLMIPFYGFHIVKTIREGAHSDWWLLSVLGAVAMVAGIIVVVVTHVLPRVASSAAVTLSTTGVSGTVDERPIALPWHAIVRALDLDMAVVLVRSGRANAIAIPKSAIPDPAALWAFLDDRLVSKRNLVRPSGSRTIIVNSASAR